MRFIHPVAWVGFFLNCGLVYILFASLNSLDFSSLPLEQQQIVELIDGMRMVLFVLLAAQIAAVGLIAVRMTAGLVLASIAGFFMMPASLIYLIGCVHSHYNWKFAAYHSAPTGNAGARRTFQATSARTMGIACGVAAALTLLTFAMGSVDLASVFLGTGLAALYLSLRARRNHALTLHNDHFTLVPLPMAKRLLIPYANVRRAVLNSDETILFEIETSEGIKTLLWALRNVATQERRPALEDLGDALHEHNVPLA